MRRRIPKDTESFHYFNANPKDKVAGDCVIRALSTAMNKSWDNVYDDLCAIGKKYKIMPNDKNCFQRYLKESGWTMEKQPRKEDNTKYTGDEWCRKLYRNWERGYQPTSPIIANIGGYHIVAIIFESNGWSCKNTDNFKYCDVVKKSPCYKCCMDDTGEQFIWTGSALE